MVGETKCRLSRGERAILGADLPSGGLWPKEIAAKERWTESGASRRIAPGDDFRPLSGVFGGILKKIYLSTYLVSSATLGIK